ncbi:Importin alpha subunit (Karyopherin alpha subunit) (Serine-rich RNA polymerase I suppressor protein) [Gonapodya sp. JEL0774]|nr:Importin alpha subunit (Karyopherin alpha subunit) (Serine-rich RNA polymerase I suppressor protein) [Gonapodya sp. JEL0774]
MSSALFTLNNSSPPHHFTILRAVLAKVASVRISSSREHDLDTLSEDIVASQLLPNYRDELLSALGSSHRNEKLRAAVCLRKFVSVSSGEAVWEHVRRVVETDLVERLAQMLLEDDGVLQYELMWVLTNIAAGPHAYAQRVMSSQALPVLVRLLNQARGWKIRWQASWTLANLCGDSRSFRDEVLRLHPDVVRLLLNMTEIEALLIESETERRVASTTLDKFATWTMANLSRWPTESAMGTVPELLFPALPFFLKQVDYLNSHPDTAHLGDVLRCLKALFADPNGATLRGVLPDQNLVNTMVTCVGVCENLNQDVLVSALGVLVNISTSDDRRVAESFSKNADLIGRLENFLERGTTDSYDASVVQHALMLLSNITASQPKSARNLTHLWDDVHGLVGSPRLDGKTMREAAWCLATGVDVDGRKDDPWAELIDDGLFETLCHVLQVAAPDGPGEAAVFRNDDPQLFAKVAERFGGRLDAEQLERSWGILWRLWKAVVVRAGTDGEAAPSILENLDQGWRKGYTVVKAMLDGDVFGERSNRERTDEMQMEDMMDAFTGLSVGRSGPAVLTPFLEMEVLSLLNACSLNDRDE